MGDAVHNIFLDALARLGNRLCHASTYANEISKGFAGLFADGAARTLARPSVGAGALTAYRQTAPMPHAAITA